MKVMYAKNPAPEGQLQVATDAGSSSLPIRNNPNMNAKTITGNFKKVGAPALSVVGGQMLAAQARKIATTMVGSNPSVRKLTDIGIPFVLAVLMLPSKNEYVKMAAVGAGVDAVHTGFKHLIPFIGGQTPGETSVPAGDDPDLSDLRKAQSRIGSGFLADRRKLLPVNTSLGKQQGVGSGYLNDHSDTYTV